MDSKLAPPGPPPPDADDLPPSYTEATTSSAGNSDTAVLQPMELLLSRQTIFSTPAAPCAQSRPPVPAYTLNRAPATLTHSTSTVEFSRIEASLPAGSSSQSQVRARPRRIYDLRRWEEHPLAKRVADAMAGPHFFVEAQTGRARVRHAVLAKGPWKAGMKGFLGKGKKAVSGDNKPALRVVSSDGEGNPKREKGGGGAIFELFERGQGRWEWRMECGEGKWEDVATEEPSVAQDGTPEHRLVMARPLARDVLDALVALWCCRVWAASADGHKEELGVTGMDDLRRRLRLGGIVFSGNAM